MQTPNMSPSVHISLPPQLKVRDYALTPDQVVWSIENAASQIKLNRCQFKRIASMCRILRQHLPPDSLETRSMRRETIRLLHKVYNRSIVWKKANLVESLVLVPDEMDLFEGHCIKLCKNHTDEPYVPTDIELSDENKAITSVIQSVVSTDPYRSQAMNLKDHAAQIFVSHIQTTLDNCSMDARAREECIKALRKLGAKAAVIPSRAKIDEVTFPDPHPVAEGGFSNVYRGVWNGKTVAVKRPRIFASQGSITNSMQNPELQQTLLEVLLWLQLSHEYVQPLWGVFIEEGPFYSMVSEWMSNGTVKEYLNIPENKSANRPLIICQIAQGLQYLHNHRPFVAHGDLKASNVLIDQNGCPRITDFGQSSLHYAIDRTNTSKDYSGTERYLPPEQLGKSKAPHDNEASKATLEGDIWSFAMLMYEIFTGTVIFPGTPSQVVLFNLVEKRELPPRPLPHIGERGLTDEIWGIMCECWKYDPKDRPQIDYVVRNLQRVTRNTQPTGSRTADDVLLEVTECIVVPTALVNRVITNDGANWKELDVKLEPSRGAIYEEGQKMTFMKITGSASEVAEARHRISEAVLRTGREFDATEIHVPKMFHGLIIGKGRCNINKIEKDHNVQIDIPNRRADSEVFNIRGTRAGIAAAKSIIKKMIQSGQNSRDQLKLSPRAIEMLSERRSTIDQGLREMIIDVPTRTVTLHGRREGLDMARNKIKAIEKEASCEVVEEVSAPRHLCDMIKSDLKTWMDIVERCCSPEYAESMGKYGLVNNSIDSLRIRGPSEQITALRGEIQAIQMIGNECVTGKRVPAWQHESMIGPQNELIKNVMRDCGAMVYLPWSGGYAAVGVPNNMYRYDDDAIKKNEVVKLVGSPVACRKARNYIQDLLEAVQTQVYECPLLAPRVEHVIKRRLEPPFRCLGIRMEMNSSQTAPYSMLAFVSSDPKLITAIAPSQEPKWTIHERHYDPNLPGCMRSLIASSAEALKRGGEILNKVLKETCRRIGILHLSDPGHVRALQASLSVLQDQYEDTIFEIVRNPDRIVIAGPSSDAVETAIHKVLDLTTQSIK